MNLTATYHILPFKELPADKFEHFCLWLVEDSGEYQSVEDYGGSGDKSRDVLGKTYEEGLDFFQCKRYESIDFSDLKVELDKINLYIANGKLKKPRRIYFVTTCPVSSGVKDKLKVFAQSLNLPEPTFWGPVILDKKVKNNTQALKNFFSISEKIVEESLPQVDVSGLIDRSTHRYDFTVVNNGEIPALQCSWSLRGFGWPGYKGTPEVFDLNPGEKKNLIIAMTGDFMKQNPIKELRMHFKFRDRKNNWYYSERLLNVEEVQSGAFYIIGAVGGEYIPAKPFPRFSLDSIERMDRTGLNETRLVAYTASGIMRSLKISISSTLSAVWQFGSGGIEDAFRELAEQRIAQMIKTSIFEEEFTVNFYLKPTQKHGFEAYRELRDSIL